MKIYVCESGCVYEGGSVFYATINYKDAWLKVRERRINAFNWWQNNIESHKYRTKKDSAYKNYKRTKDKNYWIDNYNNEYLTIKIYECSDNFLNELLFKKTLGNCVGTI